MYNLPDFKLEKIKNKVLKFFKNRRAAGFLSLIIALCLTVYIIATIAWQYFPVQTKALIDSVKIPEIRIEIGNKSEKDQASSVYISDISYEQAIINAAKNVSPSVVSIVVSKNVPVYEQQRVGPLGGGVINPFGGLWPDFQIPQYVQNGSKLQEVGAGSGFIVSVDGLVLTGKHVVSDSQAGYAILTNDGKKYPVKVLALDPVQDLAIVKIQPEVGESPVFKPVILGDSSEIQIGQTAIAIGNALGQFSNTVSVGVVSGLQRTISASDQSGSISETLEGIIQTDAAINSGNSGGPLLNLKGEVIGINAAMAQGAQSIGFAIPINYAKKDIEQVIKNNKIVYPFLGVRYVLVNDQVKQQYKLSVDYGALVLEGDNNEPAVTAGSAAAKAGIRGGDIILEINGKKITVRNSMSKIVQEYNPGDKITLHILRDDKEQDVEVILGQRSS